MNFKRMVITNQYINNGLKIIPKKIMGSIDPYLEWLKWLSYIPEFQQKRIDCLKTKKVFELTFTELEELKSLTKQKEMFLLLQKYYTNEISLEDYLKVYDFMTTASIDNLMISKLSKDELQLAEEQIKALVKLPNEVLSQKIAKEIKPENYKNLSIVDSYVLHFISKINFQRSIQSLNQEIAEDINEDEKMLWYSLKRSASSYITK